MRQKNPTITRRCHQISIVHSHGNGALHGVIAAQPELRRQLGRQSSDLGCEFHDVNIGPDVNER